MKVLKRFNPLDLACILLLLLAAGGFFMAKAGYVGVNQATSGKTMLDIDIYFVGLKTEDPEMFKVGNKAALTIRNQPVEPPMAITAVKHWQKKSAFVSPQGKVFAEADPSQPFAHDFVITISDEAEKAKDGYVVRGQKIKVGNQVELEDYTYRVQGVVINLKPQK